MIRAPALIALILLAACGRSSGGPLEPVEAPGVQLSKEDGGVTVVTVRAGAVSARVTAHWSDIGEQTVSVAYANRGDTPVRIDLGTLSMTKPAGEAVILSAADVTDVDLLDKRSDNDEARPLMRNDTQGTATGVLALPPGAERLVGAELSPFSNAAAKEGDAITLRLPMATGSRDIRFVASRASFLPF